MPKEDIACDVSILKNGDIVYYYNIDNGKAIIDQGTVKEDNWYTDGVEVHGEDWKQYVSKWFICKVERDGKILFEKEGE